METRCGNELVGALHLSQLVGTAYIARVRRPCPAPLQLLLLLQAQNVAVPVLNQKGTLLVRQKDTLLFWGKGEGRAAGVRTSSSMWVRGYVTNGSGSYLLMGPIYTLCGSEAIPWVGHKPTHLSDRKPGLSHKAILLLG